jgi:hypothetical protein
MGETMKKSHYLENSDEEDGFGFPEEEGDEE